MYLLDTNICSALINRNNEKVLEHLAAIDSDLLLINWVVAGELQFGAYKKNSAKLIQRVNDFLQSLPVLMPKPSIIHSYAQIRKDLTARGLIIGENDLWISAHAVAEKFIVVTDNTREFSRVKNLTIENWLI